MVEGNGDDLTDEILVPLRLASQQVKGVEHTRNVNDDEKRRVGKFGYETVSFLLYIYIYI